MEKKKILIVDDEEINLEFFEIMLSKLGFEVYKARDGEEALLVMKEQRPDLVLLDNIMPKLSGWEVTRIVKQEPDYRDVAHIPIVMFSAMDDVRDKIEGFELGVEDYITKPFNFSEVLARINSVLRHQDMARQLVQRERRLAVLESLNKSLAYFARHMREPLSVLLDESREVGVSDPKTVEAFLGKVREVAEKSLAALDALEEEVEELSRQDSSLKEGEISLDDLEERYQRHFKVWKEREIV
ncbi:response regulator transcription factor [Spirochaeta thermophila]|uniref:Transcriptional regulatory protein n=1 Tax=Winmispira thermophila (strain ATCC 49972 / DSM 6192 / RI 19.B1) TaxID=665571 RepID=E0RQF2_WINT6|nr:response regulator [Spirochaeta thermophila]ADN02928.1 transcriptional regulatory protein [Spirochaeta thermophila DSM 6192]